MNPIRFYQVGIIKIIIKKKSYLFVDFVLEDVDMGKMASREFIKQFTLKLNNLWESKTHPVLPRINLMETREICTTKARKPLPKISNKIKKSNRRLQFIFATCHLQQETKKWQNFSKSSEAVISPLKRIGLTPLSNSLQHKMPDELLSPFTKAYSKIKK